MPIRRNGRRQPDTTDTDLPNTTFFFFFPFFLFTAAEPNDTAGGGAWRYLKKKHTHRKHNPVRAHVVVSCSNNERRVVADTIVVGDPLAQQQQQLSRVYLLFCQQLPNGGRAQSTPVVTSAQKIVRRSGRSLRRAAVVERSFDFPSFRGALRRSLRRKWEHGHPGDRKKRRTMCRGRGSKPPQQQQQQR